MKKFICVMMCVSILIVSGCTKKEGQSSAGGKILTYWVEFNDQATTGLENMGQTPPYKYLQEKLGINIEFKHPVMGQADEQLNLMLSSGNLPDIISYPFADSYPGGAAKALKDGVIAKLDLNKAPNLKSFLADSDNHDVDIDVKLDDGSYYCFPAILEDKSQTAFYGAFLRDDLLNKFGLKKPETIADWYNVLSTMKKGGVDSPLIMSLEQLIGVFGPAYHVAYNFAVVNGKVQYMPVDGDVKGFLGEMKKWYDEGLIDQNLASVDSQMIKSYMIKGTSAATSGTIGGNLGAWQKTFDAEKSGKRLVAAATPAAQDGKVYSYANRSRYNTFGSASISTQCKDLDAAYKLLDFGYGDEGKILFNFGIEGESYIVSDGQPIFTDLVLNNPDGKSFSQMANYYGSPNGSQPRIQLKSYFDQFTATAQQKDAVKMWYSEDAVDESMPKITLTEEESSQIASIKTDLQTYADSYMLKVITGVESLDSYDAYVDSMKKRGVDKLVEVYQTAYERYLNR